jgi:hypothetical protein
MVLALSLIDFREVHFGGNHGLDNAASISGEVLDDIRKEMDLGSPRATAIVGAAFVEDHLQRLIQARLVDDQKVIGEVFGPSSALGSFAAKINF